MKNLVKLAFVLLVSFSMASCSKTSGKDAEEMQAKPIAKPAKNENHAYVLWDNRIGKVSFIVNDLDVTKGDRVILDYSNGEKTGTLETVAMSNRELMITTQRDSKVFVNHVGESQVEFVVRATGFSFTMPIHAKALIMGMKD